MKFEGHLFCTCFVECNSFHHVVVVLCTIKMRTSEIVCSRGYHDVSAPPHLFTPSLTGQLNTSMVVVTINSSNTITNSFNPKQCEIDVLDCWHYADCSNSVFLCQPLVHHLFSVFPLGWIFMESFIVHASWSATPSHDVVPCTNFTGLPRNCSHG